MLAAAAIGFTSCNDSFMERYPDTSLTEQTVFSNYNTFKTYAWGLYGVFTNTNILRIPGTNGAYASATSYTSDIYAGYLMRRQGDGNPYAFQNVSSSSSGNGWAFSFVYRVNVMLANIDNSGMTDADKEHWRSVGYFFRAYYYSELIARFGDVPWVDRVLGDSDKEIAYGTSTPRKEVADHVLNDLIYAEEHIKEEGDGENTINVHVVRALLSRFCLFEGTWRKYHALGDEDKYFDACITYSKKLMDSYPELNSDWGEMLTSDLKGMKGIILYKEYVEKELTNYVLTHVERTSTHNVEMPQHIIDMYLCKDGKTIHNSSEYEWSQDGDNSMNATFRNRDPRMYHTIMPPYKVKDGKGDYSTWSYTSDPADREYIDIMGANESCSNPGIGMKRLPGQNWSASLVRRVPNLQGGAQYTIEGKKYGPHAYVASRSGYYVWKNWDNWEENYNNAQVNTADKPVFKIEEVLLNYAEAMFETNQFTQTIADETINKLRKRAGVADMVVAQIDGNFDPKRGKYYPKGNDNGILVDPVLWEIRRERIIELMGEGFGFYDVRRWRMAPWFVNMQQKGMWISKTELSSLTLLNEMTGTSDGANGSMTEGYIYLFNDPLKEGKGWLEKYYLYQVPLEEIALNPNLTQNPGWE